MTMEVGTQNEVSNSPRFPPLPRDPFRCKLYKLDRKDVWVDLGTGFIRVVISEEPPMIQVIKELSDKTYPQQHNIEMILSSCILSPEAYNLQGDEPGRESIIVWEDAETQDYAVSLESHEDAQLVWSVLCGKEKRDVGAIGPPPRKRPKISLPKPSLKTLPDLVVLVNFPMHPLYRESVAHECTKGEWLRRLREVFHDAENMENEAVLTSIFHLVKGMFLLGQAQLTERLLSKDIWEDILGMLEYDDGIPVEKRFPHRKILSVDIKYRSVLTFTDEAIMDKIHLNYRIMYLRDHVIPRMIDDTVFLVLLQIIYVNTSEILSHVESSSKLIDQLFSQIKDGDLQSLDFIQDCCRQLRTPGFGQVEREKLYATLIQRDLLGILIPYIEKPRRLPLPGRTLPHACSRIIALDIIHMQAFHNPSALQRYAIKNPAFLDCVVRMIIADDEAVQSLASEIVRWIMDFSFSHNPVASVTKGIALGREEKDAFLSILYDTNGPLSALVAFFKENKNFPVETANSARQMICEVMAAGLQRCEYYSKVFVLGAHFPVHAAKLLSCRYKFLHHSAIRVIRAVIRRDDEQCTRYIIKNSRIILQPVIQILETAFGQTIRHSGNLIISAVLDMLNVIRKLKSKKLMVHMGNTYEVFRRSPSIPELGSFTKDYLAALELLMYPPSQGYQCGAPMQEKRINRVAIAEENAKREAEYFDDSDEEEALAFEASAEAISTNSSDPKRLKRDTN